MSEHEEGLSQLDEATLRAVADACNYSLHAHVPIQAITSRFRTDIRGDVKKTLRKLRKKGYCQEHPTFGSKTYNLTELGLVTAKAFDLP
jgi:hypothetical protein